MDIMQKLEDMKTEYGWTNYKIAKKSELPLPTIDKIYSRNASPTLPTIKKICNGFGIAMSEIIGDQDKAVYLEKEQLAILSKWSVLSKSHQKAILKIICCKQKEE